MVDFLVTMSQRGQRDVGNKMSAISTSTAKTSVKSNVSIVYTVALCSRGLCIKCPGRTTTQQRY